MKPATAIVLLVAALALLLAVHLHDEAHRYDVVMAGAGSGGSQEREGSTEVVGYLVDHKTGKVWRLGGLNAVPVTKLACSRLDSNLKETETGCELQQNAKPMNPLDALPNKP
jgi:hypothetical protein